MLVPAGLGPSHRKSMDLAPKAWEVYGSCPKSIQKLANQYLWLLYVLSTFISPVGFSDLFFLFCLLGPCVILTDLERSCWPIKSWKWFGGTMCCSRMPASMRTYVFEGHGQCPPGQLYVPTRDGVLRWQVKHLKQCFWFGERIFRLSFVVLSREYFSGIALANQYCLAFSFLLDSMLSYFCLSY